MNHVSFVLLFVLFSVAIVRVSNAVVAPQMDDGNFEESRTGSEEDFLEFEGGPVCTCGPCRRRPLTGPEKGLIGVAIVALIVIIVMAAHMGGKEEIKGRGLFGI